MSESVVTGSFDSFWESKIYHSIAILSFLWRINFAIFDFLGDVTFLCAFTNLSLCAVELKNGVV